MAFLVGGGPGISVSALLHLVIGRDCSRHQGPKCPKGPKGLSCLCLAKVSLSLLGYI